MSGKKDSKDKPEAAGDAGADGAPAKKKLSGKTLILFIVLPALLVVGGGGAAAMMLMGGSKPAAAAEEHADAGHGEEAKAAEGEHGEAAEAGHGETADAGHGEATGQAAAAHGEVGSLTVGAHGEPSYYDMPKILVNLSGMSGDRPLLLELELVLESQDAAAFDGVPSQMPRLMDQVQTFLRELRVEDLNGSAGTYRLRLELLKRFNLVLAPSKVDAVLIEGILIQ
jgi:flagellar FliL protein